MAGQTYQIRVDTSQAQSAVNRLTGALGGLAVALGARNIVSFADSITNLQNKLRTLTPSTALVERQFAAIADIAKSSRSDLAATGDLYFRIARSADQLGISLADAADITDTLAKAMASSGMSAAESAGPLLQIGQALQSGRFAGDELRSVLEGMPVVARALADEMGVPIGQVKKLGSEGKITSDVFVRAMQKARDGVVQGFGRTIPTVTQSFNVLKTSFASFLSGFDKATGTTSGLSSAIQSVADAIDRMTKNMDQSIQVLKSIGLAVGAAVTGFLLFTRVPAMITTLVNALSGLRAAMKDARASAILTGGQLEKMGRDAQGMARSWGRYRAALEAAKNSADGKSKATNKLVTALLATLGAVGRVASRFLGLVGVLFSVYQIINAVTQAFSGKSIGDWLKTLGERLGILNRATEENTQATNDNNKAAQDADAAYRKKNDAVDKSVKLTQEELLALNNSARAYYDKIAAMQADLDMRNKLIGASEQEIQLTEQLSNVAKAYAEEAIRLTDAIAEARAKGTAEELARVPVLESQLQKLAESYNSNAEAIRALVEEQMRLTEAQKLTEFTTKTQIDTNKKLRDIQDEIAKSTMTEIEQKYYDIQRAAQESAQAAIEAEEARRGSKMSVMEVKEYYRVAMDGAEAVIRQQQEAIRVSRDFSTGWQKAFRDYADNANNAARRAQSLFNKATSAMEDTIVKFARTGKFEWREFVAVILEELLRAQIQKTIAMIFSEAFPISGGAGGGFIDTILGGGAAAQTQSGIWGTIAEYMVKAAGAVKSIFTGAWETVSGIGGVLADAAGGFINFIVSGVSSFGGSLWSSLSSLAQGFWNVISGGQSGFFSGLFEGLSGVGGGFWASVSSGIGGFISNVGSLFQGIGSSFVNLISGGFKNLGSLLNSGITSAVSTISKVFGSLTSGANSVLGSLISGIGNVGSGIGSVIGSLANSAGSVVSNLAKNIGSVASGVGSVVSGIGSSLGGVVGSIAKGIGNIFGGFFANGGYLPAGKVGIVGERGPELVTGPANITPISGNTTVNYNISAVDAQSFISLLSRDPSIIYALSEQGRRSFAGRR